ncbi:MAG TPA: YCF48-related protein [Candidatus Angelobacter sp.]|nr:YCF48-related protein [Candidatus Angelobacter sp.]
MRGFALICALLVSIGAWGQWQPQNSGTDVQLRGISAVSDKVAWASGAKGTILRTIDGGATWQKLEIMDADDLDFRDIQAFDQNTAYALSIGEGDKSRIYKTTDGGRIWQRQFINYNPQAFYDCFAFWDSTHGIALSDSVDGKFPLIATSDGINWNPVAVKTMPAALPKEGAFAASGTCIATFGKNDVWFATGGPAARVFHSSDRGMNWTVAETPVLHGQATQGIFSIAFWSAKDGLAVGGDYQKPSQGGENAAVTHDGGKTWKLSTATLPGYRSAVAVVGSASPHFVAVGTSGADASTKPEEKWSHLDDGNYNAISFAGQAGWAVGPAGRIVHILHAAEK